MILNNLQNKKHKKVNLLQLTKMKGAAGVANGVAGLIQGAVFGNAGLIPTANATQIDKSSNREN